MGKTIKLLCYTQGKEQAQKRPEKTLGLLIKLILGTQNTKTINKNNNKNTKHWKSRRIFFQIYIVFKCPEFNKNHKPYIETGKNGLFKRKKENQQKLPQKTPDGKFTKDFKEISKTC